MKRFFQSVALIFLLACASSPQAKTLRVDDSTSLVREPTVAMRWRTLAPGRGASHQVDGASQVAIRLDLAPFIAAAAAKPVRIYMALAPQSIGQVSAQWTTQGNLLPGELLSGQRALVYAGPLPGPVLQDNLAVKISLDGRALAAPQRLQFYFEIDLD